MTQPVIRGVSYSLIHAPTLLLHHGTTPALERRLNPGSDFLRKLPGHLRTYEQAVAYPPNQAYLGRITPEVLAQIPRPWYAQQLPGAGREGPFGEIIPEDEFLALVKQVDRFDLVQLEAGSAADLEKLMAEGAAPLWLGERLVGAVRRAHEHDESLAAPIMLENLVNKASAVLALRQLFARSALLPAAVEYIIECSEEACGDMNQRGGGNLAKAIGEAAGCLNATGADTRAFCAAPVHGLIEAAALVQSGVYDHVVVVAGGSLAKLGLNARDHVARGLPVLEDVIGAFAIHVGADDSISPRIRLDLTGRHKIGSGSSPQAVMEALVTEPLERAGLRLCDIDRYGVEMQNPELTEPAGAGDVPRSNYRLIGALAVKRGEIQRADLDDFVSRHGFPGFAPTQGHVPSGVPVIGRVREALVAGEIGRAMIIGKGSLFLGRMTNLFDGVSVLLDRNPGTPAKALEGRGRTRVGITLHGSELGEEEVRRGAAMAQRQHPEIEVVLIGSPAGGGCLAEEHRLMERMLAGGEIAAAVTLHYPFPIGVATVGRVLAPGRGREMLIACTTGTTAAGRAEAMVRSAVCGTAVARALGQHQPTLGLLNLEGAAQAERLLERLREDGYPLTWAASGRAGGGALLRGNDVLAGTPDVLVTDSLTGNLLMKLLSAYTTGGACEVSGWGYGPGVGEGVRQIIGIISRASGAPVIAGAIGYAAEMVRGDLLRVLEAELQAARAAGLERILGEGQAGLSPGTRPVAEQTPPQEAPPEKVVIAEIPGLEILRLDEAVCLLWSRGIYARPGMGCTGPVLLVAEEEMEPARAILAREGFLQE